MINPKTILAEWVTKLQSLPNLVEALGGDGKIAFYSENAMIFGKRSENNIRKAIIDMPQGSVMIAWQGTRPGRLGNALVFVHDFSLYLKAPSSANVGYEDLVNWIVNDAPVGTSLRMLHTPVDQACEPMDFYLPSAHRNTIVVNAEGATFEYFEVRVGLIESMNP